MSIDKLKTVYSTGAFVNNVKTFFKKINEIIDYLNNNNSYIPTYTEYNSLISQVGTDTLTINFVNNNSGVTIGDTWVRQSEGFYKLPIDLSTYQGTTLSPFGNWNGHAGTYQVISNQSTVLGYITYYINNDEEIWLEVYDSTFTQVDFSTLFGNAAFPINFKFFKV